MTIDFSKALEQLQSMMTTLIERLPNMVVSAVVFGLFVLIAAMVGRLVRVVSRRRPNLGEVLGRTVQWAILLIGVLVALVIIFPTFTPAQLIQLLGLGSLALGFAFRDILENFMAGVLLLATEPYRLGDQIQVGEFEGTVEDIHTRATTIRTYDGRRVVIPNAALFTDSVIVNTAFDRRRIEYDFGIAYSDDLPAIKAAVASALTTVPGVLADPAPDVLLIGFGDYSVTLRARWWITPPRRTDAVTSRDQVLAAIRGALKANGTDFPFPTHNVRVQGELSATSR